MRCISTPKGSTYTGELEEFLAGTPLALTDVVVNPKDGAMYFAVGGRNTQSGLYRVTYAGGDGPSVADSTSTCRCRDGARPAAHARAFHGHKDPQAVETAWPYLGHSDRFIRWAARVAIEFQDPSSWREKALAETSSPEATLNALLALTHVSVQDPAHRKKDAAPGDLGASRPDPVGPRPDRLGTARRDQQLDLLRVYEVVLNRFGRPDESTQSELIARFDPHYPSRVRELNAELCQLLDLPRGPGRRRQDRRAACSKRRPRKSRSITPRPCASLKAGWTPATAAGVFLVDREGGPVQGRQQPARFHGEHQARVRSPI